MFEAPLWPLPAAVLSRPKTGFGIPIREWLSARADAGAGRDRGLRGWAKVVYRNFVNQPLALGEAGAPQSANAIARSLKKSASSEGLKI